MFRSRKSSQSSPAARNTPTTAAAATAAAQAFLANRASNANLSNSAAAAALRAHTTSPTPVGEIQTKRMQRRGSTSSNGSATAPALHRQNSNGSMTERTFREQSPSRPSSKAEKPPPLPALPKNYAKQASPGLVRRPSSAEPPQRIISPAPQLSGGRGVSLDRGPVKPRTEHPPLPKPRKPRIDTTATQQGARKSSVNFSRPMSPQLDSPTSPAIPAKSPARAQVDSNIISPSDVQGIDYSLQNAATKPVKKRKKKIAPQMTEGSHLAAGHGTGRPTGTAVREQKTEETANGSAVNGAVATPMKEEATNLTSYSSDSEASEHSPVQAPSSATIHKLTKQPSVVKEDKEGEKLAEQDAETSPLQIEAHEANGSAIPEVSAIVTPKAPVPTATQVPQTSNTTTPLQPPVKESGRSSVSPPRNARFSSHPVFEMAAGIKHEPPARAASPAKSALKHSPSRGPSPSGLANEISDSLSVGSDEGKKKKKGVRVSFDEQPHIVGEAANATPTTDSPVIFSPQSRDPASRPLFNFRRKIENTDDEPLSPVPTLPSFGSVRGRRDRQDTPLINEPAKILYGDEQARKNLQQMTSSSDHLIGAVLAQDASKEASNTAGNDPLPPEVTSVEGSGYHSDSESSEDGVNGNFAVKAKDFPDDASPIVAKADGVNEESRPAAMSEAPKPAILETIPTIAVQPATPGYDSGRADRESWLGVMPGAFPSMDDLAQAYANSAEEKPMIQEDSTIKAPEPIPETVQSQVKQPVLVNTHPREIVAEPEPESSVRQQDPNTPLVGQVAQTLELQTAVDEESDDTNDSIYSDAAEDMSDFEGDGFGSINAIVDSPVIPSSAVFQEKGKARAQDESPSPLGRSNDPDWENTKTFWSGVNQNNTESTVAKNPASTTQTTAGEALAKVQPVKIPKAAKAAKSSQAVPTPRVNGGPTKVRPMSETELLPPMRKSMRGPRPSSQVESAVPLRYPVIDKSQKPDAPRLASTLRKTSAEVAAPAPKSVIKKPKAAISQSQSGPTTTQVPKKSRKSEPIPKSTGLPKVSRTLSNGSDSSSSFRKTRKKSTSEGRYSMRQSMREGRPQSASFSSANSNSIPEPRTMRQRPMSMSSGMRMSLRDSAPVPRPSSSTAPPPRPFGFGKNPKRAPLSRRFSGSSDENEPQSFRSRYADSSDEDEPLSKLAPVRGIPKRTVEEDSTDLEDSDDGNRTKKPQPLKSAIKLPATNGSGLASGSMRNKNEDIPKGAISGLESMRSPEKEKKRGFFGALGRRKDKTPIRKSELESAARRDTPLERSKLERTLGATSPEAQSPIESPTTSPPQPHRAKLQRRVTPQRLASDTRITPQRLASDTWPLPPPIPETETPEINRPATSDGSPAPRPTMGDRRISSSTNMADGVAIGRSGKKKRFPMLRKAFGLHD